MTDMAPQLTVYKSLGELFMALCPNPKCRYDHNDDRLSAWSTPTFTVWASIGQDVIVQLSENPKEKVSASLHLRDTVGSSTERDSLVCPARPLSSDGRYAWHTYDAEAIITGRVYEKGRLVSSDPIGDEEVQCAIRRAVVGLEKDHTFSIHWSRGEQAANMYRLLDSTHLKKLTEALVSQRAPS